MKRRISAILLVVLFSLSIVACSSNVDIVKQFEKLGITQASEVTDGNLYESKAELFTNTGATLELVGYKYGFSAFYTFNTLDDIKAGYSSYIDNLRGQGYKDVETNYTSGTYTTLENDLYQISVSYDEVTYDWKGAEGLYILTVYVSYN